MCSSAGRPPDNAVIPEFIREQSFPSLQRWSTALWTKAVNVYLTATLSRFFPLTTLYVLCKSTSVRLLFVGILSNKCSPHVTVEFVLFSAEKKNKHPLDFDNASRTAMTPNVSLRLRFIQCHIMYTDTLALKIPLGLQTTLQGSKMQICFKI